MHYERHLIQQHINQENIKSTASNIQTHGGPNQPPNIRPMAAATPITRYPSQFPNPYGYMFYTGMLNPYHVMPLNSAKEELKK
jgi:hypothetical protein